ncbi:MAG: 16S rRNA (guanine(966)-N(2))-methyltransferase RsmD [Actinobacteria bacterium]|nr:16S rRNA (guanine(966)-N(2))-methyltransferase RsmD [Actinomycetota bacterium]
MRVVAGDLRGRRIEGPEGEATRPTTDKVREAVFNALNSMNAVRDERVIDLFAGSGALGIEALSRGAAHCVFVENNRSALGVLGGNLAALGLEGKSTVVVLDISAQSSRQRLGELLGSTHLVLADPPYQYEHWGHLFDVVLSSAPSDVVVVAETESRCAIHETAPNGWEMTRTRVYGRTSVGFFVRSELP